MTYRTIIETPPRYQFESTSAPCQTTNCGPTCATNIADFYRDTRYYINTTKNLVVGACVPTSYTQCRDMLIKRGVPSSVLQVSGIAGLRSVVRGGRRPAMIVIRMGRVNWNLRQYSFTGDHWLTVMDAPSGGFLIRDPNYNPPHRPDPFRGQIWYSDSVMQNAWANFGATYIVAPNAAKAVQIAAQRIHIGVGVNIRSGAGTSFSKVHTTTVAGNYDSPSPYIVSGQSLTQGGVTSNQWRTVRLGTTTRYVWAPLSRRV